jgi:hypothetical protein
MIEFIKSVLSDKGEPSSKRVAAFIVLIFTMVIFAWKGMEFDMLVTFLIFVASSLAISGVEKFRKG